MIPLRKRLAFLVTLALAAIGASLLYLYFFLLLPEGRGPAGPDVPREAFSEVWSERPVLMLGLGDSVTAGFGADPPERSYFARLASNPTDEFEELRGISLQAVFPNLEVRNLAVSSSTSDQHLKYQVEPLEAQPDTVFGLIFITTGGNDLIHNYGRTAPSETAMYGATLEQAKPWISAFAKRLDTMITTLKDKFPGGCHIFLANIYDPSDGMGDPEAVGLPPWPGLLPILKAYNNVIAECDRTYDFVDVVDMHGAFLGHGVHCTQPWTPHYDWRDPHYWFHTNIEDPNNRGYDAIRRLFLLKLVSSRDRLPRKEP